MNELKQKRLAAGFGLREFSQRIGILPSIYYNIESGRQPASTIQAEVICAALGMSELPEIPPPQDDGPWIPVFCKTVDGKPLSDDAARRLFDDLNNG